MKIYVYKVEHGQGAQPLEQVIERALREPFDARLRLVAKKYIRLHHAEERNGIWFIEFERIRYDRGPGKGHRNRPAEPMPLADDEGYSESTAALYLPRSRHLLLELNREGPTRGLVQGYLAGFNQAATNVYRFVPRLDPDVEARLNRKAVHRRLEVKIAPGHFSQADLQQGNSVAGAITAGTAVGADDVTLVFTLERGTKGGLQSAVVDPIVSFFRNKHAADPKAVKTLKVAGKDTDDAPNELLDLLDQKLHIEFDDIQPDPRTRMLPIEERWLRLQRAYHGWQHLL